MSSRITSPAIRYHGAKFRLAPWIIQHIPNHKIYIEPFGGAAGVLLQKHRSYAEVYNDLDGEVVNFFRVLRDKKMRDELISAIQLTPFSRVEFDLSFELSSDPVEMARRTAVRAQMGFGSGGATKQSTGFRIDCNRDYGTAMHNWSNYPAAIAAAGKRFEGVLIENKSYSDVIDNHDGNDSMFLLDPPYMMGTRASKPGGAYRHEMTDMDHEEFLAKAKGIAGMAIVCGYDSDMYRDHLDGWVLRTKDARISAGRGAKVRKECIWINLNCWDRLNYDLFSCVANPRPAS